MAVTADSQPWWQGIDNGLEPANDWRGEPYDPAGGPAAHPNARFTVSAKQCPSYSPVAEDPQGVPISAIVFGGRRASLVPLVFQARDWTHGVLVGAAMGSETTAAATGKVGVVRRDPMAMLPFIGYNAGDYFGHWVGIGKDNDAAKLPKMFYVNWFRRSEDGGFLWPGFGENSRVLKWVIERLDDREPQERAGASDTPIGFVPTVGSIDTEGLDIESRVLAELLSVDPESWRQEIPLIEEQFDFIGERLPVALREELEELEKRLSS